MESKIYNKIKDNNHNSNGNIQKKKFNSIITMLATKIYESHK